MNENHIKPKKLCAENYCRAGFSCPVKGKYVSDTLSGYCIINSDRNSEVSQMIKGAVTLNNHFNELKGKTR